MLLHHLKRSYIVKFKSVWLALAFNKDSIESASTQFKEIQLQVFILSLLSYGGKCVSSEILQKKIL